MFFCEDCEIFKNTFIYRTPVAASGKIWTKSLKSVKFQFQLISTTHDIMGSLYIARNPQKIFVVVPIHIAIQTSKQARNQEFFKAREVS